MLCCTPDGVVKNPGPQHRPTAWRRCKTSAARTASFHIGVSTGDSNGIWGFCMIGACVSNGIRDFCMIGAGVSNGIRGFCMIGAGVSNHGNGTRSQK